MTDKPDLKTTAGKITDLDNRLSESRQPTGAEGPTDARQRVLDLLDEGSFVETDALARHRSTDFGREHDRPYTDGVVTGYGTIDGRRVCVFSQDASVFEGTLGEVTGEKICKLYDLALKTGVPMVGIHESAGPRVQEGIVSLSMHARIMAAVTRASGLIPQVAVVVGDNEGMAAFAPALADLVIVARGGALHQAAPAVVQEVAGAETTAEELGGADALTTNGTAHLIAESDAQALDLARTALSYLPVNNRAEAPRTDAEISHGSIADNVDETARALDSIVPDEESRAFDITEVIAAVVDPDSFFEIQADFAGNVVTGFARIEGRAVGLVANQPLALAGTLDGAACDKAARFIRTCDAFNTPIIEFVDSPGFLPQPAEEQAGLLRRANKLAFAFAEASVGKLTIITRKAIGPAYVFMGSKDLGADLAYAWPTAQIAVTQASQAARAIYGDAATPEQEAELAEQFLHPYAAAERGLVDAVIEPATTRGHLVEGLRLLERKISQPSMKKHGNITL
ncbi:acyl-CoA carboxylase subunit beta [Corynebacterium confusum]|uniref:acyl-CoA carboxylase subunit beta n=1 Tax=Corynebacterium confusum TaxID=71254 RepID=UPI0025B38E5A|nr:acyl-CoA carboxylase subunit beta [Corynebacterium confusum]WJY89113.1 putative propionyl-CoA carboxylase beta chain 5 [Corynebacterium confusum]